MESQSREADKVLLKNLIAGEHAAIIQYMMHRFYAGEGEIGCEIEEVARREMIHWKWLNERLAAIGGQPVLDRGEMNIGGPDLVNMLQRDVELEVHCIKEYEDAILATQDPVLKRQFTHHLEDEKRHKETFEHLVQEAMEMEATGAPEGEPTAENRRMIEMLNQDVSHEYGAILQYLHQSHSTRDLEMSQTMLNAAMDEMKHMALMSDEVVELGGHPHLEPAPVVVADSDEEGLKANIEDERNAQDLYESQIREFKSFDRSDLADLMVFIRQQENFHWEDFKHLLSKKMEALEKSSDPEEFRKLQLTVGSLLGKEQNSGN